VIAKKLDGGLKEELVSSRLQFKSKPIGGFEDAVSGAHRFDEGLPIGGEFLVAAHA
jgi:hypothetical protein